MTQHSILSRSTLNYVIILFRHEVCVIIQGLSVCSVTQAASGANRRSKVSLRSEGNRAN